MRWLVAEPILEP